MAKKKSHTDEGGLAVADEPLPNGDTQRVVNDIVPSLCRACWSAERTNYENVRRVEGGYLCTRTGRAVVAVVLRDCRCLSCGQRRCDREPVYAEPDSDSESE